MLCHRNTKEKDEHTTMWEIELEDEGGMNENVEVEKKKEEQRRAKSDFSRVTEGEEGRSKS